MNLLQWLLNGTMEVGFGNSAEHLLRVFFKCGLTDKEQAGKSSQEEGQ